MRLALAVALVFVFGVGAALAAEVPAQPATALRQVPGPFDTPRIIAALSMPPQFELLFDREMPTPGWSVVVDAVEVDGTAHRAVIKISDIAPQGQVAQVVTPVTLRVPLGVLGRGRLLVELWHRRGTDQAHVLVQALVLDAE